jgi:hypothetical protein
MTGEPGRRKVGAALDGAGLTAALAVVGRGLRSAWHLRRRVCAAAGFGLVAGFACYMAPAAGTAAGGLMAAAFAFRLRASAVGSARAGGD